MEDFKEFLDRSTIGGLNFISSTKNFAKIFWIIVVLTSFIVSFIEIHNLFQNWELNPIITTIETFPIREEIKNKFLGHGLTMHTRLKAFFLIQ